MDWLQFWSSIISSVAWPVCIVIIALIFRRKLSDVIGKLLKVELPGGISAEFDKTLTQVEDAVITATPIELAVTLGDSQSNHSGPLIQVPARPEPLVTERNDSAGRSVPSDPPTQESDTTEIPDVRPPSSTISRFGRRDTIAEEIVHPTGVVMEAWKELESQIARLAVIGLQQGKVKDFDLRNIPGGINRLKYAGIITADEADILHELRRLRNLAAHSHSDLSSVEAKRFVRLARPLAAALFSRHPE